MRSYIGLVHYSPVCKGVSQRLCRYLGSIFIPSLHCVCNNLSSGFHIPPPGYPYGYLSPGEYNVAVRLHIIGILVHHCFVGVIGIHSCLEPSY